MLLIDATFILNIKYLLIQATKAQNHKVAARRLLLFYKFVLLLFDFSYQYQTTSQSHD